MGDFKIGDKAKISDPTRFSISPTDNLYLHGSIVEIVDVDSRGYWIKDVKDTSDLVEGVLYKPEKLERIK